MSYNRLKGNLLRDYARNFDKSTPEGLIQFLKRPDQRIGQLFNNGARETADILKARNLFLGDLKRALVECEEQRGIDTKSSKKEIWYKAVLDVLNFNDGTTVNEDIDTNVSDEGMGRLYKTTDPNRLSYEDHIINTYGYRSRPIMDLIEQRFKIELMRAAFWDVNSNMLVDQSDTNLNDTIKDIKNKLYRKIISYLRDEYSENSLVKSLIDSAPEMYKNVIWDDKSNKYIYKDVDFEHFARALNLFFNLEIANKSNYITRNNEALFTHYINNKSSIRSNKIRMYKNLFAELNNNDPIFKKFIDDRYTRYENKRLASSELYTGQHYSKYFADLKLFIIKSIERSRSEDLKKADPKYKYDSDYVRDNATDLLAKLDEIESDISSYGEALLSYTMLTHFDELVAKCAEGMLVVDEDNFGTETNIPFKYKHAIKVSQYSTNWNNSEDAGIEHRTSSVTFALIENIPIKDFSTGLDTGRNVDIVSLVKALSSLFKFLEERLPNIRVTTNEHKVLKDRILANIGAYSERPTRACVEILNDLFAVPKRGVTPLADIIGLRDVFNGDYVNLVQSVWETVYNIDDPVSIFNQICDEYATRTMSYSRINVLNEIANLIDRNAGEAYAVTLYNHQRGRYITTTLDSGKSNDMLFRSINKINASICSKVDIDSLQPIVDKYKLYNNAPDEDPKSNYKSYNVDIPYNEDSGEESKLRLSYKVHFDQNSAYGIFARERTLLESPDVSLNELEKLDIRSFVDHLMSDNPEFTGDKEKLHKILRFFDDIVGTRITYNPEDAQTFLQYVIAARGNQNRWLRNMLTLAMRGLYINTQNYNAARDQSSLREYLIKTNDNLYYKFINNLSRGFSAINRFVFNNSYGNLSYIALINTDNFVEDWAAAKNVMLGRHVRSTVRSLSGDHLPVIRIKSMVKQFHQMAEYAKTLKNTSKETPISSNIFASEAHHGIKEIVVDHEIKAKDGTVRTVKSLSFPELTTHFIFDKFWGTLYGISDQGDVQNTHTIYVQPGVYSDKNMLYNMSIDLKTLYLGQEIDLVKTKKEKFIDLYSQSVGQTWVKAQQNSRNKLCKVYQVYINDLGEKNVSLNKITDKNLLDMLHSLDEWKLLDYATQAKVQLERNFDYRTFKNNNGDAACTLNETLWQNARIFTPEKGNPLNASKLAIDTFKKAEISFIKMLLDNGTFFNAFEDNALDIESWYYSRDSGNIAYLYEYAKELYGENGTEDKIDKFLHQWIDENRNRLVIARKKVDGKYIDITHIEDLPSFADDFELNPLLEKFMYASTFFGDNIAKMTIGVDANNKLKQVVPLVEASKVKSAEEWNTLGYGNLTDSQFEEIKSILSIKDLEGLRMALNEATISSNAKKAVQNLLDLCYDYCARTLRTADYKRWNAFTATFKNPNLNAFDSIAKDLHFAVMEDPLMEVFDVANKSGGKVEVHNGGSYITMVEAILENNGLCSDAVGENRKAFASALMYESGDSLQMKSQTYTITNKTISDTIGSSLSNYKIYKKLLDIPWTKEDNINLLNATRFREFGEERARNIAKATNQDIRCEWFEKEILQENKLYYKNENDEIVQIIGFGQSSNGIYYTLERGEDQVEYKVYHLFYDENDETSIHIKTNTPQSATKLLTELSSKNVRTINSLFQLWKALGAYRCCDMLGNSSENNNYAVVGFMNNVGEYQKDVNVRYKDFLDQTVYKQPLKDKYIAYIGGTECFKKFQNDVNPVENLYNNKPLKSFKVRVVNMGIQQDAEITDLDRSTVAFQTQMLANLAFYGKNHSLMKRLNEVLALQTEVVLKPLENSIDKLLGNINGAQRQKAKSDLYQIVGQRLFNGKIANADSSYMALLNDVKQVFVNYSDHSEDMLKFAFSDNRMFHEFFNKLVEGINKGVINKRSVGAQDIKRPGHDIVQYYEVWDRDKEQIVKLMPTDVLRAAKNEYRQQLLDYILYKLDEKTTPKVLEEYKSESGRILLQGLNWAKLQAIVQRLRSHEKDVAYLPKYYLRLNNVVDCEKIDSTLMRTYLEARQEQAIMQNTTEGFQMFDTVQVVRTTSGKQGTISSVIDTVTLDSPKKYYDFKDGIDANGKSYKSYGGTISYRMCTLRPNNLKHERLSWRYLNTAGDEVQMNWHDLPIVRKAYENPGSVTMYELQDALDNLEKGFFINKKGKKTLILEGTLRKERNEQVIGNLVAKKFGIERGETLGEVLAQGRNYFTRKSYTLRPPASNNYDIALMRGNGKSDLIALSDDFLNDPTLQKADFGDLTQVVQDEKEGLVRYRIYAIDKQGELKFEIGRWVDINDGSVVYEDGHFKDANGTVLSDADYRLLNGYQVQKKIMFVNLYRIQTQVTTRGGNNKIMTSSIFRLADINDIAIALRTKDITTPKENEGLIDDAAKLRSDIISDIYRNGKYIFAEVNPALKGSSERMNELSRACEFLINRAPEDVSNTLRAQLRSKADNTNDTQKEYEHLRKRFINNWVNARWSSFQATMENISSRIPAQSFQSFKAHNVIGWIEDQNIAYDSVYEEWLEGSDFDGDETYLSSFEFNDNGILIGWSSLFQFGAPEALMYSRNLPVARGIKYEIDTQGIDITEDVNALLDVSESSNNEWRGKHYLTPKTYFGKTKLTTDELGEQIVKCQIEYAKNISKIINKIEDAGNKYFCKVRDSDLELLKNTLEKHSFDLPQADVRLAALKNAGLDLQMRIASSPNVFINENVAVDVGSLRDLADQSPLSKRGDAQSVFQPLVIVNDQILNAAGGAVTGIYANGLKAHSANTYYWTHVLESSDTELQRLLKFNIKLPALSSIKEGKKLSEEFIRTHIIDLNTASDKIREALKESFYEQGLSQKQLEEAYKNESKLADLALSQLLSAATDNAKEMILGRINGGPEYAKMYITLLIMGCEMKDAVRFMTSPVAELIVKRSHKNIYASYDVKSKDALNAAKGIINVYTYLRGDYNAQTKAGTTTKRIHSLMQEEVIDSLLNKIYDEKKGTYIGKENANKLLNAIYENLKLVDEELSGIEYSFEEYVNEDSKLRSTIESAMTKLDIKTLMSIVIKSAVKCQLDETYLVGKKDVFMFTRMFGDAIKDGYGKEYLLQCQQLFEDMKHCCQNYELDGEEYSGDQWMLKFERMEADVLAFEILNDVSDEMTAYTVAGLSLNQGLPATQVDIIKRFKAIERIISKAEERMDMVKLANDAFGVDSQKAEAAKKQIVAKVLENNDKFPGNKDLGLNPQQNILRIAKNAFDANIVEKFDAVRYICDLEYRQKAVEYMDLMKIMTNGLRLLETLPQYRKFLDAFRVLISAFNSLSVKQAFVFNILDQIPRNVDYYDIKNIERYIDELLVREYLDTTPVINLNKPFMGFNATMDDENVNSIDLTTEAGRCSFNKWVTTAFFNELQDRFPDNTFVKHMEIDTQDGKEYLTVDNNLLVQTTPQSKQALNECIIGLSLLDTEQYNDQFTYGDLIALYNIIVNKNQSGADRLTALFTNLRSNKIMREYEIKISNLDYSEAKLNYNKTDLMINMAPKVYSQRALANHTEPYVWLYDSYYGFKLMRYDKGSYMYKEDTGMFNGLKTVEGNYNKELLRKQNYLKFTPFLVSTNLNTAEAVNYIQMAGSERFTDEDRINLINVLGNLSLSSKIFRSETPVPGKKVRVSLALQNESSIEQATKLNEANKNNPEYKRQLPIRIIDLGDVPQNEKITWETVVNLIEKLDSDIRESLIMDLKEIKPIELTLDMVLEGNLQSNTTIDNIFAANNIPKDTIPIDPNMLDQYVLINATQIKVGKQDLFGRQELPDGRIAYIFDRRPQSAEAVLRHISQTQLIEKACAGGESDVLAKIPQEYLSSFREILSRFKTNTKSLLLGFISNNDNYRVTLDRKNGGLINTKDVITNVLNSLLGIESDNYKRTAFENLFFEHVSEVQRNTKQKDREYAITKDRLYNEVFCTADPTFKRKYSFNDFMALTEEQMNELLYDPASGIFAPHPQLMRTEISKFDSSQEVLKDEDVTTTDTVKSDRVDFDTFVTLWTHGKNRIKVENLLKKPLAEQVRRINEAKINFVGKDGDNYQLEAKIIETNGKKPYVSYMGKAVATKTKVKRDKAQFVYFKTKNTTYENLVVMDTKQPVFRISADEGVNYGITDSCYRGYYIYTGRQGDTQMYFVSKDVFSPQNYARACRSLEEATQYIDSKINNKRFGEIIKENALYDIYHNVYQGTTRNAQVSKINTLGTIYTIFDFQNDIFRLSENALPDGLTKVLLMRLDEFVEYRKNLKRLDQKQLERIDSSQKAMLFIIEAYSLMTSYKYDPNQTFRNEMESIENPKLFFDHLNEQIAKCIKVKNNKTNSFIKDLNERISAINNATKSSYVLEEVRSTRDYSKVVVLNKMAKNNNFVDVTTERYDNLRIETLKATIDALKEHYNLKIETFDGSDLNDKNGIFKELIESNRLNSVNLETIHSFVYNGTIYINTSIASSKNLWHEMAHMFLGILKVTDQEAYQTFTEKIRTLLNPTNFNKRVQNKSRERLYENMAKPDIIEEVLADYIAEQLNRDPVISQFGSFTSEKVNLLDEKMKAIFSYVQQIITDSRRQVAQKRSKNHFDSIVKILKGDDSATPIYNKFTKRRKITNYIERLIKDGLIIENC